MQKCSKVELVAISIIRIMESLDEPFLSQDALSGIVDLPEPFTLQSLYKCHMESGESSSSKHTKSKVWTAGIN